MKITRRNFVQSLGTAAAIAVSGAGLKPALAGGTASSLFEFKEAQVWDLIGRSFTVTVGNGRTIELTVAEVDTLGSSAYAKRGYSGECFSVIFESRQGEVLDQGVYQMRTAGIDAFSALLVPTGRRRQQFEMVVNHLSR